MKNAKKTVAITVYDYYDAWHGSHKPVEDTPKRFDVHAHCVGGREGIMAFFEYDNHFCIANGDDGGWWLTYVCALDWKDKIIDTINLM
jgi:hypothetical protein